MRITPLSAASPEAIENLLDAAFGADRKGRTAYRIREGCSALSELSFAAWESETLVGTLQSWPVALAAPDGRVPLVLVGPVAVLPDRQQGGVGKLLMTALLDAANIQRVPAMAMIGDPEYYDRFFGFSAAATGGWRVPGPVERHRLLARIRPGVTLPAEGALVPNPDFALAPATA